MECNDVRALCRAVFIDPNASGPLLDTLAGFIDCSILIMSMHRLRILSATPGRCHGLLIYELVDVRRKKADRRPQTYARNPRVPPFDMVTNPLLAHAEAFGYLGGP